MNIKITKDETEFLVDLIETECDLTDSLIGEPHAKLKDYIEVEENDEIEEDNEEENEEEYYEMNNDPWDSQTELKPYRNEYFSRGII